MFLFYLENIYLFCLHFEKDWNDNLSTHVTKVISRGKMWRFSPFKECWSVPKFLLRYSKYLCIGSYIVNDAVQKRAIKNINFTWTKIKLNNKKIKQTSSFQSYQCVTDVFLGATDIEYWLEWVKHRWTW